MIRNLLLVLFAAALISGCKDDKEDDNQPTCVAGRGGAVTLVLQPEHHGEAIPGIVGYPDSAMIKFNRADIKKLMDKKWLHRLRRRSSSARLLSSRIFSSSLSRLNNSGDMSILPNKGS